MNPTSVTAACLFVILLGPAVSHAQDPGQRFQQWDKNQDGKLTKDELPPKPARRFEEMDANRDGVVTRGEMEALMKRRSPAGDPGKTPAPGQTRRLKPNGEYYAPPAMKERVDSKLKVGDAAPGFSLRRLGGGEDISLSEFKGKKPVVLVFGSITCSPFRESVIQTFDLHKQYGDRAEFLMIYIREAHPESTILFQENGVSELKKFTQTDTLSARRGNAQSCGDLLKVPFPLLLDGEDNATLTAYGAWPNRLVVVGKDGKIAWDSGEGPRGFRPEKLGQWLRENL